jgi:hypothetical protein
MIDTGHNILGDEMSKKYPPLKRQLINIGKTSLIFSLIFYGLSLGIGVYTTVLNQPLELGTWLSFFIGIGFLASYVLSMVSLSRSRVAKEVTFKFGLVSFLSKTLFYYMVTALGSLLSDQLAFTLGSILLAITIIADVIMVIKGYKADEEHLKEMLDQQNQLLDEKTLNDYLSHYNIHYKIILVLVVFTILSEYQSTTLFTYVRLFVLLIGNVYFVLWMKKKIHLENDLTIQTILFSSIVFVIIFIINLLGLDYLQHIIIITLLYGLSYYPVLSRLYKEYDLIQRHYDKLTLLEMKNES